MKMTKECSYCGATGEYIENGGVCECGAGAEWISVVNDEGYNWDGELMFNNISEALENKRSRTYS